MSELRQADSTDLSTFSIEVDGVPLPSNYQIEFIDIRRSANHIASADIGFIDGDPADQRFELSSSEQMRPGGKVEIRLGYNHSDSSVFVGVLLRQQIKVNRQGKSRLLIFCKDAAFVMAQNYKSAYFEELSDSDLIERLIAEYGLPADIAPTSVTHKEITQFRQLDWDLMVRRAEQNGLYCATDDGVLRVQAPINNAPKYELSFGENVIDLDLKMDARFQYASTKSVGWSAAEQQSTEYQGVTTSVAAPGNISLAELAEAAGDQELIQPADGSVSAQLLQQWADASKTKQSLAKVLGTITTQGIAGIKIGDWVNLKGFSERFDGLAWVGGLGHSLSAGNWLTTVQLGLPPRWHQPSDESVTPPLKSLESSISGLHIGVVTQLAEDPDSEDRVQVKLPILGEQQSGVWTRMSTLDAGNGRGWVVRPEIGDEVIVGFIDNDANQAILLGALHSSANPSPVEASDDNHEKGWVTRSGMQLIFDDDKVSVNLETPSGNIVQLNEDEGSIVIKDQNDNEWLMDSNGIKLTSNSNIAIETSADVALKGSNVTIEANASLALKGSGEANLESSGNTVVKGALVQIN